ncbi:MAG: RHS repeat-associated protein [Halieaceae bacterium]|jgi:RHS repeat-associated protein
MSQPQSSAVTAFTNRAMGIPCRRRRGSQTYGRRVYSPRPGAFLPVCIIALTLLVAGSARAHFIIPTTSISGTRDQVMTVGDTFETSVSPSGPSDSCTVLATVTVGDSTVLSGGGTKTEKHPKFTLTALKAGRSTVTVFFDGQTNDVGDDCPAVQTQSYTIEVKAKGSTASQPGSGSAADPVNTFSGELYMNAPRPDLDLGGPMPLLFQRYYGAYLRRAFVLGDLGSNWRHNFDARLQWNGTRALYTSWRGEVVTFDKVDDAWVQQSMPEVPFQIIAEAGSDTRLYDPREERVYTFDYTTGGPVTSRLIRIEDRNGNTQELDYDDDGRLLTVSDGLGRLLQFTYHPLTDEDQIPKISSVGDGVRLVTFFYQDPVDEQALTNVIDARGNSTVYRYEDTSANADHALMLSLQRPEGNIPFVQTFFGTADGDVSGRVATQTDALGNTTSFSYDPGSGLTTIDDPGPDGSREHTHNSDGKQLLHRDENGNTIGLDYDAAGLPSGFDNRDGASVQATYHAPSGNPASVVHEDGTSTGSSYATRMQDGIEWHDRSNVTFPDGTSETYVHDAQGNIVSRVTRAGYAWSWTYNGRGQPLTETNPEGGMTTYAYHPSGTLERIVGPDGISIRFEYDDLLRLLRVIDTNGGERSFTYDAHDNLASGTDELGDTTVYNYDRNDNLLTTTDPAGGQTSMSYDEMDRLLRIQDTEGNDTTYTYDQRGRATSVTYADGSVFTSQYDALGRLVGIVDETDRVWSFDFSADGALLSQTEPDGNRTLYANDANKDPIAITSPRGFIRGIERDALGRPVRSTDALGQVTDIVYDARDLATRITLPGGVAQGNYQYDGLGLLTVATDPNGTNWTHTRDGAGRATAIIDPLGQQQAMSFDSSGRVGQVSFAGNLGSVALDYDAIGRLTGRSFSDGETISLAYDDLGRLTTAGGQMIVGDRNAATPTLAPLTGVSLNYQGNSNWLTQSNDLLMTRDARGRVATVTYAPGLTVTYSYDPAGRLTGVTDWSGRVTAMSYDTAGRRTAVTHPNGIATVYDYDADGSLVGISESRAGAVISAIVLTRDALGRSMSAQRDTPLEASTGQGASTYTYDAASQVQGFSYDAQGRLIADDSRSYVWGLDSSLRQISSDAILDYKYDAFGLLVGRTVDGSTREFVWNHATPLPTLAIERRSGADQYYFIYEPDGNLLYRIDAVAGSRIDYHFDEGGNTLFLSNEDGQITDSYAYLPFGTLAARSGTTDNAFTWRGESGVWHETAAGGNDLYYMRARWFDAGTLRFISRDPARLTSPREINTYQYAALDPLQNDDPSGLAPRVPEKPGSTGNTLFGLGCTVGAVKLGTIGARQDLLVILSGRRAARAAEQVYRLERGLELAMLGRGGVEGARANQPLMQEVLRSRQAQLAKANKTLVGAKSASEVGKVGKVLTAAGAVLAGGAEYLTYKTDTAGGRAVNAVGVGGTSAVVSLASPHVAVVNAASGVLDLATDKAFGVKLGAGEVLNNASRGLTAVGESVYRGDCGPMHRLTNKMIKGDFGKVTEWGASASGWLGEKLGEHVIGPIWIRLSN